MSSSSSVWAPEWRVTPWTGRLGRAAHAVCARGEQLWAGLFTLTLAWGLLAFPLYKHMPSGYVPVALGVMLAWLLSRAAARARLSEVGRWSEPRFVLCLLALATTLRMAAVGALALPPTNDHALYADFARQWLRGPGYPPTAVIAPGIVAWLGAVQQWCGTTLLATQLSMAALGVVLTGLTYAVARHVVALPAARRAAFGVAVFPSLIINETTLCYTTLLTCTLLVPLWLFVRQPASVPTPASYAALIGVCLGVSTLVKPIGLLLPFVLAVAAWRRGATPRAAVRNGLVMLAALWLTILPWSFRNARVLGSFLPVVSTSGSGLWAANNPAADGLFMRLPPMPPGTSEVERDRRLGAAARAYLAEHPAHVLAVQPRKWAYLWGTSSSIVAFASADRWPAALEAAAKFGINTAWAALAALVIATLARARGRLAPTLFWPLVALVSYTWLIHLFYEAQSKYHLPVVPALCVLAALALSDAQVASSSAAQTPRTPEAPACP